MRQICLFISVLCAAVASVAVLLIAQRGFPSAEALGTQQTLLLILGIAAVVAVTFGATQFLTLTLAVLITRGPSAIGWVSPENCRNLLSWFSHEWRFVGREGLQEGWRFCGVEVSLKGTL